MIRLALSSALQRMPTFAEREISSVSKVGSLSRAIFPNLVRCFSQQAKESAAERLVKALRQGSVNPNQAFENGWYILHYAAEANEDGVIQELVKAGSRINAPTLKEGDTALHRACSLGRLEAVFALLNSGAKLHVKNNEGNFPLESALLGDSSVCSHVLIKAGAAINQLNPKTGFTPLMLACKLGNSVATLLLLLNGANPDLGGNEFPLHLAVHNADLVKILLEKEANPDSRVSPYCPQKEKIGDSPLHSAVRAGNFESVQVLLAYKANHQQMNGLHQTPLNLARQLKINVSIAGDTKSVQKLEKMISLLEIAEETPLRA